MPVNLVQRFFLARDILDLLRPEPRVRPATFRELLNEMDPALRDWVLARQGPTVALDGSLPRSPVLPMDINRILQLWLLQQEHKLKLELPVSQERIDQWVHLTHEMADEMVRNGTPVLPPAEQRAALQIRLNAEVARIYKGKPAPRHDDADAIKKITGLVLGSTTRMAHLAIQMLPQARRRKQ
jgi:hypothetical protein